MKNIREILREGLLSESKTFKLLHGSGVKINGTEGFSTDKVATGVGNDVFGWGLYFTDLRSLAEDYSRNKTNNMINKFIGLVVELNDGVTVSAMDAINTIEDMGMFEDGIDDFITFMMKNKKVKDVSKLYRPGYIYHVTVTPSKPNEFDWYGQYSEGLTGGDYYKKLTIELGSKESASMELYRLGYYCIKYKVGGDNGYNYVLFNDSDITIDKVEKFI